MPASWCASYRSRCTGRRGRGGRRRHPRRPQLCRPTWAQPDANVFEAVKGHVDALQSAGKRVVFALWSDGARDRMSHVLADHALLTLVNVQSWPEVLSRPSPEIAFLARCSASKPGSRPTRSR